VFTCRFFVLFSDFYFVDVNTFKNSVNLFGFMAFFVCLLFSCVFLFVSNNQTKNETDTPPKNKKISNSLNFRNSNLSDKGNKKITIVHRLQLVIYYRIHHSKLKLDGTNPTLHLFVVSKKLHKTL
jgi:hypothetical protein